MNTNLFVTESKTERYLDLLFDLGFICGINEPTRVIGESSTCSSILVVDYKSGNTTIIERDIIDHYSIYMEIEFRFNDVNTNRSSSKVIDKQIISRLILDSDL